MANQPPTTTAGPEDDGDRTPKPPPTKKLTPANPPKTGKLTGKLHPLPPSDDLPALTGPLEPWPEMLELIGSPTIKVNLRTGEVDEGRQPSLGDVELEILRSIARRQNRPAHRWLLHHLAFQSQGDPSRVDEAVADLKAALGQFGNRIEMVGKDGWRLWPGPD